MPTPLWRPRPIAAALTSLALLALPGRALAAREDPAQAGVGVEIEDRSSWHRAEDAGEAAWERAYEAHEDGDFDAAILHWSEALRLDYRRETSLYNLACAHARKKDVEGALTWLERAIDAGFDAGGYLERDDDLDALRGNPRFERLVESFGRGESRRAMARLERMAAAGNASGDAWYQIGMELHQLGQYDAAIRAWKRSAELGAREAASIYNVACAQARKGETGAALDALERAVELGFGDGGFLDRDDDLESLRAEPRYTRIREVAEELSLPSGGWDSWFARWARDSVWQEAARRYQAWVDRHPESGRAWFNLGFAALKLDDPGRAVAAFTHARELRYRSATTAYNLACAHALSGDKDQAFAWLERARSEGFAAGHRIASDPDLDSLRDDPRFPATSHPHHRLLRKLFGQ